MTRDKDEDDARLAAAFDASERARPLPRKLVDAFFDFRDMHPVLTVSLWIVICSAAVAAWRFFR